MKADSSLDSQDSVSAWRRWALVGGPALGLLCWWLTGPGADAAPGEGLSHAGRATLGMLVWMAVWWISEAADLTATALLPLCMFPLLGIVPVKEAAAPYADPIIFLFMGGFMVALAMQRWGLARRVSLLILQRFGTAPRAMTGGLMLVTGLFSMFVSNTATTAMMLPIVMSIVVLWEQQKGAGGGLTGKESGGALATCLLLGTAWAASIGGMATIIGTPPNTFAVSFLAGDSLAAADRLELGFATWLLWGLPCAGLMLLACWALLVFWQFRLPAEALAGGREMLREESLRLGPVRGGEMATAIVFTVMVALWIVRPWLSSLTVGQGEAAWRPLGEVDDSVIAMAAGVVLFLIPARRNAAEGGGTTTVNDWQSIQQVPFGTLLLFGGGLSLANAVKETGVDVFLGAQLEMAGQLPTPVLILLIVTTVCLLSEIAGNLAVTVSVLPVLAALAEKSGLHPGILCLPATLAASCGFMLPVATPPNAIVFGTGRLKVSDMMRAGFALDLVSIVIVTLISCTIVRWWLGG